MNPSSILSRPIQLFSRTRTPCMDPKYLRSHLISRRKFTSTPALPAAHQRKPHMRHTALTNRLFTNESLIMLRELHEADEGVKKVMKKLEMRPQRTVDFFGFLLGAMHGKLTPKSWIRGRWDPTMAERYTEGLQAQYPEEPQLIDIYFSDEKLGELMFALGNVSIRQPSLFELGEFMLSAAVECGHVDAAVLATQVEQERQFYVAPMRAKAMIKEHAEAGTNWKAMVITAIELTRFETTSANRKRAYDMARRAFEMTEPSNEIDEDRSKSRINSWSALRKLALDSFARRQSPEDKALADMALAEGASKYDDPEACARYAGTKDVEPYSDEWVRLTTKAAMACMPKSDPYIEGYQPNAADSLGKYYLEKYGWYPCRGEPSQSSDAKLGFEWLEVAAHTHVGNPELMKVPYLKMAIVMRENGRSAEGLKFLQRGREQIDAAPAEDYLKARAKAWLNEFIDGWDGRIHASSSSLALLGEPQMLPKQRA